MGLSLLFNIYADARRITKLLAEQRIAVRRVTRFVGAVPAGGGAPGGPCWWRRSPVGKSVEDADECAAGVSSLLDRLLPAACPVKWDSVGHRCAATPAWWIR